MSQHSISSTTSAFQPINPHNGGAVAKPLTSKLDKSVASVTRLQSNANILKQASNVLDETINTLKDATFKGKSTVLNNLKRIQSTLLIVHKNVGEDSVTLSPIPSIGYAFNRKKANQRCVSPEASLEAFTKENKATNQTKRPPKRLTKSPPNKRIKHDTIEYAPPLNEQYTPREVVDIVVANPKHKGKIIVFSTYFYVEFN